MAAAKDASLASETSRITGSLPAAGDSERITCPATGKAFTPEEAQQYQLATLKPVSP